jgi:hypothetical protein
VSLTLFLDLLTSETRFEKASFTASIWRLADATSSRCALKSRPSTYSVLIVIRSCSNHDVMEIVIPGKIGVPSDGAHQTLVLLSARSIQRFDSRAFVRTQSEAVQTGSFLCRTCSLTGLRRSGSSPRQFTKSVYPVYWTRQATQFLR